MNGIAMGYLFFVFFAQDLLVGIQGIKFYTRYADDTFCDVENEAKAVVRHPSQYIVLNISIHMWIAEQNNSVLPFLDVLIHRADPGFLISVYWKSAFMGLSTPWDSFCSKQQKINLIKTSVHRVLAIFSPMKWNSEIESIRKILGENCYTLAIMDSCNRETNASIL